MSLGASRFGFLLVFVYRVIRICLVALVPVVIPEQFDVMSNKWVCCPSIMTDAGRPIMLISTLKIYDQYPVVYPIIYASCQLWDFFIFFAQSKGVQVDKADHDVFRLNQHEFILDVYIEVFLTSVTL